MRRLVLSTTDHEQFAAELDKLDCLDCAHAVINEFAFGTAGIALDFSGEDEPPRSCDHKPVNGTIIALHLALCAEAQDPDMLAEAVAPIGDCPRCLFNVLTRQSIAIAEILNDAKPGWRAEYEGFLLAMLDQAERS